MSSNNLQNKNDVKKRKLEEGHQTLLSTNGNFRSSKNHGFLKFCKKKSLNRYHGILQPFNDSFISGILFEFIL